MTQLVLASTSRYRAELLRRIGVPFLTCAPNVDEQPLPAEDPEALAIRLARAKAAAGAASTDHAPALVIGSDQVAVCGDRVLGKPGTAARARAQLAEISGQQVRFLTGVCLLDTASGTERYEVVPTDVDMRALTEAEIADYVAREQPLDCAGAFKSEALGIVLFDAVRSDDPTALIGLPLIAVCRMLREAGVRLLAGPSAA